MKHNMEQAAKHKQVGLHYCKLYENIVRYNHPMCGKCKHSTYPKR